MGYSDIDGPRNRRTFDSTAVATLQDVTPRFSYGPPERPPEPEGGVEISNLFRALFRRKFLIIATVLLGAAIAAALTLRVVPRFQAAVTMEIQAQEMQIIQGASVEPSSVADAEFIGTQVAILKSRALAERIAESLNLVSERAYADPSATREIRLGQAASAIMNGLSIVPLRGARVIEVRFISTAPAETARIANAVAEHFIEMNLERRYSATSYARKFLEERLAMTRSTLEDAERRLVQYSSDKEILDLDGDGEGVGNSLDVSALVSLSASLTEAQNARIMLEQQYREVAENPNSREMLASAALQTLKQTRSQLFADYQIKLSTLRSEHPEMLELQARLSAVDREIANERAGIVKALEAEYKSAVSRESALNARVQELKETVQALRSRSIDYTILHREVDTLRSQYNALLQRLKEVSITSGVGSSQVSILDRAEVPGSPFEPDFVSGVLRGLALSFAVAVALALFVEFLDDRIKTPDDLTDKLGLRVIGIIPRIRLRAQDSISKLMRNPRAPITEAFASARTSLRFAPGTSGMKTLLVTGCKPSEGKTTTTLALATSFAAIGKKVLIIDADLRRPSFAFNSDSSAGLAGVLLHGHLLKDHVVVGPAENLHLLPAGKVPRNPAELLATPRLGKLLADASEQYDLVFVDSPPVLSFADAPILSSVCDGVLFVVQSGSTFRQTINRAIGRLHSAQANIVGGVLTKFDPRKAGYGKHYGYGFLSENDRQKVTSEPSNRHRVRYFAEGEGTTRVGDEPRDNILDQPPQQ